MSKTEYSAIVQAQRNIFQSGKTLSSDFRKEQLRKLIAVIKQNEQNICKAIYEDLHVGKFEAATLQTRLIINEAEYFLKHLDNWMKPQKVKTPLFHFRASSSILRRPYGLTCVIAPWNYPFMLALRPAIGAIAAGNCCIIKPSEITQHTAAILEELINQHFNTNVLRVINTDAAGTQQLLQEKFDFIFFTGGTRVGKLIYEAAAKNLTPVSLELGGKSPCVVCEDANLEIAVKRIVWGKFMNAGQTCIAPDYLIVHESIKEKFIELLIHTIKNFYPNVEENENYARIVNATHTSRLISLLEHGVKIRYGGHYDAVKKFIEPCILELEDKNAAIMKEEIFGPLLPVLSYKNIDEIFEIIHQNPNPLVAYLFTRNESFKKYFFTTVKAGDVVINETILHFGHLYLPIGGRGNSGMGKYQGENSFDEFSHKMSVLNKKFYPDISLRYPPYTDKNFKRISSLIRKFWS